MNETLIRGDINELQCILDFQKRGYYCSIPFSGSCRYDLIADINNTLLRIQCKSSSYKDGVLTMHSSRVTTNTKGSKRYKYTKDEIDFFYTYWKNYSFLLPVEEVGTAKLIRVKKPEYIQRTMCVGSDYLFDKVIESIIKKESIKKYFDYCFYYFDEQNNKKYINKDKYTQRQINWIKESVSKGGEAYGHKWCKEDFPELK